MRHQMLDASCKVSVSNTTCCKSARGLGIAPGLASLQQSFLTCVKTLGVPSRRGPEESSSSLLSKGPEACER
jgi:hypothetical protein